MSPNLLLREFDQVVETPASIQRLRRFVLDLAVRGKLVEPDATDSHAALLIEKAAHAPREAPLAGRYRSLVDSPVIESPFQVPENWAWTRLGRVAEYIQRGKSPRYSSGDGPTVISQKCVRWEGLDMGPARAITPDSLSDYEPIRFIRDGDLLWNSTGTGTIGRVSLVSAPLSDLVCDSHVTIVRCSQLNARYIQCWLQSDYVYGAIEGAASGSTNQVELTLQVALGQPIPVPPLAEQRRIAGRVTEVMALLDELEATQRERDSLRDALRTASLQRLTLSNGDGAADLDDVRFFLDRLRRLITKPDHVEAIRQTILDLAVQGCLVSQDPQDEPASKLLNRVCVGTGYPVLGDASNPVPAGWETTTIGQISSMVTSGSRGWAEYYSADGAKFIRAQNIRFGRLALDDLAHVSLPPKVEGVRTRVDRGDVLIVITGAGVTNPAPLDVDLGEAYVSQHVGLVKLRESQMSRWILVCLMAPAGARSKLVARAYGAGKPGLNLDNIRSLSIPIPPLAEQHRIVAKVDELMAMCDELEIALANSQTGRGRLLEVLLHEAVAGGDKLAASASA